MNEAGGPRDRARNLELVQALNIRALTTAPQPSPNSTRASSIQPPHIVTTLSPLHITTKMLPIARRAALRAPQASAAISRSFTKSVVAKGAAAEGHGDHYDSPSGWLWGVKPGEKAEEEGWEKLMYWGFGGCMVLGVVGVAFKPDTS